MKHPNKIAQKKQQDKTATAKKMKKHVKSLYVLMFILSFYGIRLCSKCFRKNKCRNKFFYVIGYNLDNLQTNLPRGKIKQKFDNLLFEMKMVKCEHRRFRMAHTFIEICELLGIKISYESTSDNSFPVIRSILFNGKMYTVDELYTHFQIDRELNQNLHNDENHIITFTENGFQVEDIEELENYIHLENQNVPETQETSNNEEIQLEMKSKEDEQIEEISMVPPQQPQVIQPPPPQQELVFDTSLIQPVQQQQVQQTILIQNKVIQHQQMNLNIMLNDYYRRNMIHSCSVNMWNGSYATFYLTTENFYFVVTQSGFIELVYCEQN